MANFKIRANRDVVVVVIALLMTSLFFDTTWSGQLMAPGSFSTFVSTLSKFVRETSRLLPRPSATPVFIGGQVVEDRRQFGYAARIIARYSEYNGKVCSGALVHPQWVVTAAHCVTRTSNASGQPQHGLNVYLGDIIVGQLEPQEQQFTAWAEIHPKYDPLTRKNDLALLKLSKPAKIDNNTFPIPMSKEFASALPAISGFSFSTSNSSTGVIRRGPWTADSGEMMVFAGWGQAGNHSEPIKLRYAELAELTTDRCRGALIVTGFMNRMHGSSRCFVGSKQDACFGDDGGPVVRITREGKISLVAIHSTYAAPTQKMGLAGIPSPQLTPPGGTITRCRRGSPNIATNIQPYEKFIHSFLVRDLQDDYHE